MQVTLQYAAEHLAELASFAQNGEEVEIVAPNASVRLVASANAAPVRVPRKSLLGTWEGLVALPSDDDWAAMKKEDEELMLRGGVLPLDCR